MLRVLVQVLARSSPTDKYNLVKLLKKQGEVVAVTGTLCKQFWLCICAGTTKAVGKTLKTQYCVSAPATSDGMTSYRAIDGIMTCDLHRAAPSLL